MNYNLNTKYPKTELESISKWWQVHRDYDINEYEDYVEIVKRLDEQIIEDLRRQREFECFPYINRGQLWYFSLTDEQRTEFQEWYTAWLNVTETLIAPKKPIWLK